MTGVLCVFLAPTCCNELKTTESGMRTDIFCANEKEGDDGHDERRRPAVDGRQRKRQESQPQYQEARRVPETLHRTISQHYMKPLPSIRERLTKNKGMRQYSNLSREYGI